MENINMTERQSKPTIPDNESKPNPFWIMVKKEIGDHVTSWRFYILMGIILLTCIGALYTALSNAKRLMEPSEMENTFFFLNLFTISDGTLPPFFVLVGFLRPLLGISMGFDAVNSEHNRGTLSRILAQPIPRDYVINTKFTAALLVIAALIIALSFTVMGAGLFALGIPPTVEEFVRILVFMLVAIIYISFWLNLSVFFSVRFRQPATSALSSIAVWLFFTVFYPLLMNIVSKVFAPGPASSLKSVILYERLQTFLMQIIPGELFNLSVSALLIPTVRSVGPLSMEQMAGSIPGPLPLGQSVIIIWPQLTGILTLTLLCFVLSYISFMRREIRSR